jgi:hypothetical protein
MPGVHAAACACTQPATSKQASKQLTPNAQAHMHGTTHAIMGRGACGVWVVLRVVVGVVGGVGPHTHTCTHAYTNHSNCNSHTCMHACMHACPHNSSKGWEGMATQQHTHTHTQQGAGAHTHMQTQHNSLHLANTHHHTYLPTGEEEKQHVCMLAWRGTATVTWEMREGAGGK